MNDQSDELVARRRAPFGDNPHVGGRGRATQRAILEAAGEAFEELGYHHTSVEAITDRVGCSRATFYQYFEGKEDLFRRLAARLGDELGALLDSLGDIDATRAGRHLIRGWLTDFVDVYNQYRPVADTFAMMIRTDDAMVTGSRQLTRRYGQTLERAIVAPVEVEASVGTLSNMAVALAYAACYYRDRVGSVPRERFVDALADVIHRALFGPIAGVNLAEPLERTIPPSSEWSPEMVDTSDLGPKGLRARQRLLDSAMGAFVREGYDGTRVDHVSAGAELSYGAFYRYFDSKAAIFRELAYAAAGDLVDRIRELPDPPRGMHAWAVDYLEGYRERQGLFSIWPEARAAGVDASDELVREVAAVLADALEARPHGDVDADVLICFALLDRVASTTFSVGSRTFDEAAAGLATFLERGVLGREPLRPPSGSRRPS